VGQPLETAAACTSMAAVYSLLGDVNALRAHVAEGLRAARLAHAPLRAIRLRAALAAGLLRAGKTAEARPLVARLARLELAVLPLVVRRVVERVLEWKPSQALVSVGSDGRGREVADAVVELLGICQSIVEEEGAVRKAVATLRSRLSASAAGCFGLVEAGAAPIATDGRDPAPSEVAQRAAETGMVFAPDASPTGREAAVPVRFGGRTIGALACRWAADVSPDWNASGAVLAAGAAVIAPCLRSVLDRRAVPVSAEAPAEQIVGASQAIVALREEIQRAARAPFNVVIEGESGTGKELVARAIHRLGPRRQHRLCAINCAAITDELLDAELFGHARGAFTGAVAERKGLFEEADAGTLVLDEVSELSPRAQAKLLRAIQEGEVRRVGENLARAVDVRIVAASNRPLRAAVEQGTFRRDLLYRLEVIRIVVPPLRERAGDIPLLAGHFWKQATSRLGSRATLAPATLAALARGEWPGNVRELQNVMASLAVSSGRRGSIGPDQLPSIVGAQCAGVSGATLDEARRLFDARFVQAALARAGGHRGQAAKELGLTRQGLAKLLARLQIA
jgi:transcriptional regulator with GAF, ATPase, and Fis domain